MCITYIIKYIYISIYIIIRVFRMILRNSTVAPRNGIYKHWPKISVSSGSRTTVLKEFPHVFDLRRELTLLPSSVGSNARMQREK